MKSLPSFYGWCMVSWAFISAISLIVLCLYFLGELSSITIISVAIISLLMSIAANKIIVTKDFHARYHVDKIVHWILFISAVVSITITIALVASVLFESVKFFQKVPFFSFLFGTESCP